MIKGDIIEGIIKFNSGGNAYLVIDELTKDVQINKGHTAKALHLDKVKVKITAITPKIQGEVVEIIERIKDEFVGTLEITNKHAFFIADDDKIKVDFFIPLNKLNGGKTGQKVVIKLSDWKEGKKNPNGEVIRIIGEAGEHETEIHSIMETYGLPYKFSKNVLDEADSIPSEIPNEEFEKRLDLRGILTITCDGFDAKDLDDALSVEYVDGNVKVYIHIADVSYYVKENSKMYEEALSRSTSVYLVDRVIPMLPEKLSNNLCSLNPNSDKLSYSFIFTLDNNGKVIDETFCKSIINSNFRLTYDEVQNVIEGGETYTKELKDSILLLNRYSKKINKLRDKSNPLKLNSGEVKFKLDENNKPIEIIFKYQNDANKLIENFMVLTNMRVCEFLTKKDVKNIHRTHSSPDINKLQSLKTFVGTMGYDLDLTNEDKIKESINILINKVKGTPEEDMINNLITRCMQKAIYETTNRGHYGLSVVYYSHVTSPIRRVVDLKNAYLLNKVLPNNGYLIK